MYDTILVGTDGSDGANRAVEHALSLGAEYGATVHAISVVDTSRYGEPALSSTELVVDNLEDRAHDLLEEIKERGEGVEVEVVTRSCHGRPHEEVLAYADEVNADLVVLGRHGLAGSRRHVGSVADRVVAQTDHPVQLV
jgi:nucleotide-binding universal stress UspA family protein